MGVTIAYRGRLADPTRIEDFEDRVLDFALEMGGLAQIWRSHDDERPERMVRGVILHLAPGQETTSLLIAPEGWLVGLLDIQDAEQAKIAEPSWCFIKTQFGPLEGHVALVEMFRALKREFMPDLEVTDEGGYWETGDLAELANRRGLVGAAISGLAEGLERHGLSREAAEDPDILLRRIERIAAQVQRVLGRPSEHPPVTFADDDDGFNAPDPDKIEAEWDEMYKHNRRQQERLERALEERRGAGQDDDSALEDALRDLAIEIPGEDDDEGEVDDELDEPWRDDDDDEDADEEDDDNPFAGPDESDVDDEDDFPESAEREARHPLLEGATGLLLRLHKAFGDAEPRFAPALRTLFQGAGDATGGLAQALPRHSDDDDDDDTDADMYGLRVVQFKRALRGAAFARGAMFLLRPAVTAAQFDDLYKGLDKLEKDIFQELGRLRAEHRADES